MWINDGAGYMFLSLAVLIVGWMSIFYIKINIVKRDESPDSPVQNSTVSTSSIKSSARKADENAVTQKHML